MLQQSLSQQLLLLLLLLVCSAELVASATGESTTPASSRNSTGGGAHSNESHQCVLGSLICVHDDLKPFLVTALWLLFLVVLLLVFERTEHAQHHVQHPHPAVSIDDAASEVSATLRSRLYKVRRFCNKVLLHGIKEYLPTSCLQILLGLAFAGAFQLSGYHIDHLENLNPGLFFHFLLPIIIINAGFGVEKRHFYFNLPAILSFAVIGTIIVALVIGYCIYAMSIIDPSPFSLLKNVTKIEALTFGALISAVDPVAVLALFERMHLNKPLYMTLFGESVLNDAVSVVLYNMFTQAKAAMVSHGVEEWHPTSIEIAGTAVYSIHVAVTGLIIGIACGVLASGLMRILPNAGNQNLAVLIVVISGYLSFYLAELIAASGILSTFVCSIVMSIYLANLTPISQSFLRQSTKSYAEISEGFIYLVMGVSALQLFFGTSTPSNVIDVPFIFITLFLCIVLRFACVYGIGYLLKLGSLTELRASDFFILSYGGLRGAIALALSLMLDRGHYKFANHFFACTMMMVLLTCFINGISLKPLIMLAKIEIDESVEDSLWDQIMNRTCDYVGFFMGSLTGYQPLMKRIYLGWNRFNDKYLRRALLKSKVYNEAQDEGIYELHRKIVADEFLKFATQSKSLIDLNALRSDSMVYAIRRVSSMGNTGMVHSASSHRSLNLPPIVRQALSVGETLDQLDTDTYQQEHNNPVLDMEALSNNLAKSERDQDDQQNHHRHFMRDNRIINPRSWQDKNHKPTGSSSANNLEALAKQQQQSGDQLHPPHLSANPRVKFSINADLDDDEADDDNADAKSASSGTIQFLTTGDEKPEKSEKQQQQDEAHPAAAEDSESTLPYASRYYAHHPHIIQLPRHSRNNLEMSTIVRKGSDAALLDPAAAAAVTSAASATGSGNGRLGKKKSVSFAMLSPDQGTLDPRTQQMKSLPEPASDAGAASCSDCHMHGRFQVRVCNEDLHHSEHFLPTSVPYIRVDDNETAEPSQEFKFEVNILDSLPWNRGNDSDRNNEDAFDRYRRGADPQGGASNQGFRNDASESIA
ncbi:hypothetical protein BOX15_Mlig013611g1 [Macrostomum lignano]|uniref:Sodium/hydrogen exchanger n=1 Tax=Macrostomum lignano TaxID=282301 RepID=A0A267H6T1_9PLAT|nr:hypothetical protein BOX15_Mlig013611g1 [Macrostomum lignano]